MMYKYVVSGIKKIEGTVKISGSKNASLPLIVASLLTDEKVVIHNIPKLLDVEVLIKIIETLGKKVVFKKGTVTITSVKDKEKHIEAPYKLVKKMRGSIIVLGPVLAKNGECRVSYPGGCAFGPRPIDLHIEGMKKLGAKIDIDGGYINATAKKLKGVKLDLSGKFGPTVLGTDNVMMAATLAQGTTIIENAATEPECSDLAHMLVMMGAKIKGIGTNTLTITGVSVLHGVEYTVIPDRIEAGTYLAMATAIRGKMTLTNTHVPHISKILELLESIGCIVHTNGRDVVTIDARANNLKAFDVEALPYPEFPTDLQAIFTALACTIKGKSTIKESVFPDRFTHIAELARMGANIELKGSKIIVKGNSKLSAADVQASDLRAGAALVLAGLSATGTTNVHRIYHIERGYEDIVKKLANIGISIKKQADDIL